MIPPEQQQPNHVVATIENLPPEGSGAGSSRNSMSAPSSSSVRQRIRKVLNRYGIILNNFRNPLVLNF
ncbi:hypothetical protein lerEdw1_005595 [Lerista edwardsae]|nr:hypothetical protein lerEdw1_005595 [Lerista edwardsae]